MMRFFAFIGCIILGVAWLINGYIDPACSFFAAGIVLLGMME